MIRVNDDYVIDVSPLSYTAKVDLHKTTKKTGKPIFTIIGYYTTLKNAVKGILAYDTRNTLAEGEKSLNEAIKTLEEANNKLEEILGRIPEENE